jgi:hypothetical protein
MLESGELVLSDRLHSCVCSYLLIIIMIVINFPNLGIPLPMQRKIVWANNNNNNRHREITLQIRNTSKAYHLTFAVTVTTTV